MTISRIADELDRRSVNWRIGGLQDIRKELKGRARRVPGRIFGRQTVFERWAFHLGGRHELQFNIGLEEMGQVSFLRYGVAFSLEASQTLPDVASLFPKIDRFNEYLRVYPDQLADLRMWHFVKHARSDDYSPSPIPPERCRPNTFIFLGKREMLDSVDLDEILATFDRLLPIYEFVEDSKSMFPIIEKKESAGLVFKAGCTIKKIRTSATPAQQQLDVVLRHNAIQSALYDYLSKLYGEDKVGGELPTGNGTRVDMVVRHSENEIWFYEIKTDLSARACVRAAIAQLLEYSYWPSATMAARLVVVGEPRLDRPTADFLRKLRDDFSLPLHYAHFDLNTKILEDTAPM